MSTTVSGTLDHLVLNMRNEEAMLRFYAELLGLGTERLAEYRAGAVPFPSIRIDSHTLIDLLPASSNASASPNLDHLCIAFDRATWEAARSRLAAEGFDIRGPHTLWGARGHGTSIYVSDPDGNGVELKTYDREPSGND